MEKKASVFKISDKKSKLDQRTFLMISWSKIRYYWGLGGSGGGGGTHTTACSWCGWIVSTDVCFNSVINNRTNYKIQKMPNCKENWNHNQKLRYIK